MSKHFLTLCAVIALGGCAYAVDDSIQDLTVVTPGANDAMCYVIVDGVRYKFRPPQTQSVSKSRKDMTIDCLAPGNRREKIVVAPDIEKSTYGNVVTGVVPGAAWDYASNAMFRYPSVVEVSFENTPIQPEALPAQNNPDIRQPEDYDLEEFRPAMPRLNSDRYETAPEIRRHERSGSSTSQMTTNLSDTMQAPSEAPAMDKGDLMNVINDLGSDSINPSSPSAPADMAPVPAPSTSSPEQYGPPIPLFPGQ